MKVPTCPICGAKARTVMTSYGRRHSCCDLWSWEGAPLVSADTHQARQRAHSAFDPLWKRHGIPRSEAYAQLAKELGLTPQQCHMKLMDVETANRVPAAARAILECHNIKVIE